MPITVVVIPEREVRRILAFQFFADLYLNELYFDVIKGGPFIGRWMLYHMAVIYLGQWMWGLTLDRRTIWINGGLHAFESGYLYRL